MIKELGQAAADVSKELLSPPAKELGRVFGDMITVSFGWLEKIKIKQEHNIELFRSELQNGLNNIDSNNLVQPQLHIVGPAIEASKYYIESEELRNLFVKLLVSSSDITKQIKVHPSFVEIIKQLSPEDARCLKFLFDTTETTPIAGCGHFEVKAFDSGISKNMLVYRYLFPFPGLTLENLTTFIASVDNLVRLKLININAGVVFANGKSYEALERTTIIDEIIGHLHVEHTNLHTEGTELSVKFLKDSWELTQYGSNFCESCMI